MQPVSQPAAAWSRGVYRLGARPEQAEFGAGGSGVGLRAARREAVLERVGERNAEHRALGVGARVAQVGDVRPDFAQTAHGGPAAFLLRARVALSGRRLRPAIAKLARRGAGARAEASDEEHD